MNKDVFWLRISFWVGAIVDAVAGAAMLCPSLIGKVYGLDDFNPGAEYRYAMGLGASLMFGWTFLLLWADRKPIERKGVLLLTVFPVITGLTAAGVYAVASELIEFVEMIPTWSFLLILAILFLFSYFKGGSKS